MATWRNSPNFTKGRGGKKISFIVMHWFGVGTLKSADNRFMSPTGGASAHYGISGKTVYQWVKEEDTAWHAGNFDANQKSIGIEHDATTTKNASAATYESSAKLIASIWKKYGKIPLRKHKEFKPTQCPGTLDIKKIEKRANEILNPPKPDPCKKYKDEINRLKSLAPKMVVKEVVKEIPVIKEVPVEVVKTIEKPAEELSAVEMIVAGLNKLFKRS